MAVIDGVMLELTPLSLTLTKQVILSARTIQFSNAHFMWPLRKDKSIRIMVDKKI